jgi:hypothetical protein
MHTACHTDSILLDLIILINIWLITVDARCKARYVFPRSNIMIMGLNPTQGLDVSLCLFCVSVVLCRFSALRQG